MTCRVPHFSRSLREVGIFVFWEALIFIFKTIQSLTRTGLASLLAHSRVVPQRAEENSLRRQGAVKGLGVLRLRVSLASPMSRCAQDDSG